MIELHTVQTKIRNPDLIKTKSYFRSNLTAHSRSNGPNSSFPIRSTEIGEVAGWCHGCRWGRSGSPYGALFFNVILPAQPGWHKGSILLTCGGEIGSLRAGEIGVARADFNAMRPSPGSSPVPRVCSEASLSSPLARQSLNFSKKRWKTWVAWLARVHRIWDLQP
jgi:hypothetical protein